jgi:hypothetical protein
VAQPSRGVAPPDEVVPALDVVVPALDPESLLDPPQPDDAATSKRVTTPKPRIRKPPVAVTPAVSAAEPRRGIVPMG